MKTKKKFDSVKMMREIRDDLSKEMMGMSFEEQRRYIEEGVKPVSKVKKEAKKKVRTKVSTS